MLKIVIIVFSILASILIIMQFTDEVRWDIYDFAIAGILLMALGASLHFLYSKCAVLNTSFTIALSILVLLLFVLIWVELSVGIFGSPFGGD